MRVYIPEVGERVKLRLFEQYIKHGIGAWAWLKVIRYIPGDHVIFLRVLNGAQETEQTVMADLGELQKPLGWKPVYTITCSSVEQAEKVRDEWFGLGIHVWASHDLSCAGRMAYTPARDGEVVSPHWQFTGNPVETVPAEKCAQVFRIEVLHQWEPQLPPTSRKSERAKAIKEIRAQAGVELSFVPDGAGGRMPLCERAELIYEPEQR